MAKYDGLIIPRSYNDYINKSDPAGVAQALQLTGVMDNAPTAKSTKPVKSGGIFAANAVIMANKKTLSGVAISAGSVVRVLFTAALTGSDATTGLTLTYNGNTYAVKVGKNGALANFLANNIDGSYIYCQAYTTLDLMFDGSQFIIMGNPVVISSADYTIYTDGSKKYTKSGTENYSLGSKTNGTISRIDYFSFPSDAGWSSFDSILFEIEVYDISTLANITLKGCYKRNSYMKIGSVVSNGMSLGQVNQYGTVYITGLNSTASNNKFNCWIKKIS